MRIYLLSTFFLLSSFAAMTQQGYLFVKKGHKKVRTYTEGDYIHLQTDNQGDLQGPIRLLKNDSLFIGNYVYSTQNILKIYTDVEVRRGPQISVSQWALITLGVGLSTAGMAGAGWETPKRAALFSAGIGYGPLLLTMLIRKLPLQRKAYPIGKKYYLQVLDFHLTD